MAFGTTTFYTFPIIIVKSCSAWVDYKKNIINKLDLFVSTSLLLDDVIISLTYEDTK